MCHPLTSLKLGSDTQICRFFAEVSTKKRLKICYRVSLSKNFQQQSCSAVNCLSSGINILAGDDPIPVRFGPKGTDPQQEGCIMFDMRHTVHLAIADIPVGSRLWC